jgi:hypothetical protein
MKAIYGGINGEIDIVWSMFEQRDSPLHRLMARAGSYGRELGN